MKMNSELWKSFDVGRAPVLRMRTVAWHVNTVMNCDELNAGELLLNKMAQDNILKQRDGKWVFTRLTLARKRDAKRLPQVLAACIQLLHRDKEGIRTQGLTSLTLGETVIKCMKLNVLWNQSWWSDG